MASPPSEPSTVAEPTSTKPFALAELTLEAGHDARARASDALSRGNYVDALKNLEGDGSAAAALLRARAHVGAGQIDEAQTLIKTLNAPAPLDGRVAVLRMQIAAQDGDSKAVAALGAKCLDYSLALRRKCALPLAQALAEVDPGKLVESADAFAASLDPDQADARSAYLTALIKALRSVSEKKRADAVEVQRYLEEPVSSLTPSEPPRKLSLEERVQRGQALLDAHRNERVLEELVPIADAELPDALRCQRDFALGLAARKLRKYKTADTYLTRVTIGPCEEDLVRRARYLVTKVISIYQGTQALKPIEAFATEYPEHSMVDDVLFWAGDMVQRRGRRRDAEAYYERVQKIAGDHCAIARWRLAWMAYQAKQYDLAKKRLHRLLERDGCSDDPFERARARYWLARIAQDTGDAAGAAKLFEATLDDDPLGFYAQVALRQLETLDPPRYRRRVAAMPAPQDVPLPALCPGTLVEEEAFGAGLALYRWGLLNDAAEEWKTVEIKESEVLSTAHATAQGLPAKPLEVKPEDGALSTSCAPDHPGLLITLLLNAAGERAIAQWRLRTTFASYLAKVPTGSAQAIWRAAYPLEHRHHIEAAEREAEVPKWFMQALAREESAFDDQVVSWAGAYGLTQLLLSTGKHAGRLLSPSVTISDEKQLLDPALNARLGAAYMAELLGKYRGHPGLALAAYNAGESVASTWAKRHSGDPIDLYGEAMTIKETRGYVKRVLRTWGIYRWTYGGEPAVLGAPMTLPEYR